MPSIRRQLRARVLGAVGEVIFNRPKGSAGHSAANFSSRFQIFRLLFLLNLPVPIETPAHTIWRPENAISCQQRASDAGLVTLVVRNDHSASL